MNDISVLKTNVKTEIEISLDWYWNKKMIIVNLN